MSRLETNCRKIILYRLISHFWLVVPILVPFYESNGLTPTEIFVLQAIYSAAVLLLEIPSGYLADAVGRKNTLIIGAACLPAGLLVYSLAYNFLVLAAAELLFALSISARSGSDSALLYDTLSELEKESDYKGYEGRACFWEEIGFALASVLGGLLGLLSLRLPFYLNAATAALLLPLSLSLVEPKRKKLEVTNHLAAMLKVSKYSLAQPRIRSIIMYASLITAAGATGLRSYYLYFGELQIGLGYYGLLFAIFGFSMAYGSKKADEMEEKLGAKVLFSLFLLVAPVFFCLGMMTSALLIPFIMVNGFLWGGSEPIFRHYLNQEVESDIRATVLSVKNMVSRVTLIILAPVFGRVVELQSLSAAYLALGILVLLAGSICLNSLSKNKII